MLTAALIVGILAASWFLLVSPKRGEASDLRTQAATQEASNQALQQQLSLLSNGDLGWIQVASFVVTGLLAIAAAVGVKII